MTEKAPDAIVTLTGHVRVIWCQGCRDGDLNPWACPEGWSSYASTCETCGGETLIYDNNVA
jgi:hypothetical protein